MCMPATDVVVIGGGCTGSSTAFWLAARYRQRVTLLEQRRVGSGPTGRSSGIVRMHYSYGPLMAGSLLGPCSSLAAPGRAVFWRRWASTCPSGPRAMLLALLLALCLGAATGQLLAATPLGPAVGALSSG